MTMRNTITATLTTAVFLAGGVTSDRITAAEEPPADCAVYTHRLDVLTESYTALDEEARASKLEAANATANLALTREQASRFVSLWTAERQRTARLRATIARLRANR